MKKITVTLMALALLAGLTGIAFAQENLGKQVAAMFKDQEKVKQVSYEAWKTARDEGLKACMEKSAALLKKAAPADDRVAPDAAADAFASWWYNVAGQYWSDRKAQQPGGEDFAKAAAAIKIAREVLEKALGWDPAAGDKHFQDAYRLMQGYK